MKNKILNAVLAASLTFGGLSTVAFADTGSSSPFDNQYSAKNATETQLLAEAQAANSTDSTIVALLTTVQNINQQVTALYTSEQALAVDKSSIPSVSSDNADKTELAKFKKERTALLNQSNNEWNLVKKYNHHKKDKQYLNKSIKEHSTTQNKLNEVDKHIKELEGKMDKGEWKNHPYDGGLSGLQEAILRLQDSSIHYLKEAIQLEQSDSATTSASDSTATNGSTNDTSPSSDNSPATGTPSLNSGTPSGTTDTNSTTSGTTN